MERVTALEFHSKAVAALILRETVSKESGIQSRRESGQNKSGMARVGAEFIGPLGAKPNKRTYIQSVGST